VGCTKGDEELLSARNVTRDSDYWHPGSAAGKNAAGEAFVRYVALSARVSGAVFLAASE
jgi:hypothetical protein